MSKEIKYKDKISDYEYAKMHRSMKGIYSIDIDDVEFRSDKGIVAIICRTSNLNDEDHIYRSKPYIWKRTEFERKIVLKIAEALNVKSYYVIHLTDLSLFHVHRIDNLENFRIFNQAQYKEFLRNLS